MPSMITLTAMVLATYVTAEALADVFDTYDVLRRRGHELNPVMRVLMRLLGMRGGLVLSATVRCVLAWILAGLAVEGNGAAVAALVLVALLHAMLHVWRAWR